MSLAEDLVEAAFGCSLGGGAGMSPQSAQRQALLCGNSPQPAILTAMSSPADMGLEFSPNCRLAGSRKATGLPPAALLPSLPLTENHHRPTSRKSRSSTRASTKRLRPRRFQEDVEAVEDDLHASGGFTMTGSSDLQPLFSAPTRLGHARKS